MRIGKVIVCSAVHKMGGYNLKRLVILLPKRSVQSSFQLIFAHHIGVHISNIAFVLSLRRVGYTAESDAPTCRPPSVTHSCSSPLSFPLIPLKLKFSSHLPCSPQLSWKPSFDFAQQDEVMKLNVLSMLPAQPSGLVARLRCCSVVCRSRQLRPKSGSKAHGWADSNLGRS